jgi:hypothetical protein
VQILQLLPHHLVGLVRRTVILQLVEQPGATFRADLGEDLARGELLQVANGLRQVGAGEDGVEMGVEDDPAVDFESGVGAAVGEGTHEDVATGGRAEDGGAIRQWWR